MIVILHTNSRPHQTDDPCHMLDSKVIQLKMKKGRRKKELNRINKN